MISGNPPATSGLLPPRWGKEGCYPQFRLGPTLCTRVPVPRRVPATCSYLPFPLKTFRPQSLPSAASSEAPEPGAKGAGWSRCPVPRRSPTPQNIAKGPFPDRALRLPEAEAGPNSSLAWDAHHRQSLLSREPGATHVSKSAARGQRKPLQGRRLLVAEAPLLQAKPAPAGERRAGRKRHVRILGVSPQGAGARRARQPASERRSREGGLANRRKANTSGRQGPRGGAGGRTAVPPLRRKPTRSQARARTHVHTAGSENTSENP